jgi:hypothetical protein
MFLAGNDDQMWPSGDMAEMLYSRRRATGVTEDDQKLRFEKVGHVVRFPYLPTTVERYVDPEHGGGFVFGGKPEDTILADITAWSKTLGFLEEHLRSDG